MKINTRDLPYEEVLKLPRLQHKTPRKPSRLLATVVRIACIPTLRKTGFSYTTERMDLVGDSSAGRALEWHSRDSHQQREL